MVVESLEVFFVGCRDGSVNGGGFQGAIHSDNGIFRIRGSERSCLLVVNALRECFFLGCGIRFCGGLFQVSLQIECNCQYGKLNSHQVYRCWLLFGRSDRAI